MHKYLLGGAIAGAVVAIAPAIAQTAAPAPVAPQIQDRLGEPGWQGHARAAVHTRAEVAAHVRTMFAKLDSNRDGSITKAEAETAKASRGDRASRHMPGNAMPDRGAMFDRMDSNRDGSISRAEFAQAPMRQGPDGDGMMRRMHMKMGMGGMGGHMFDMADANHDGRVTLQEATNAALRHFDTADVNRDGQLTPAERMQMHQRMRAQHKPG